MHYDPSEDAMHYVTHSLDELADIADPRQPSFEEWAA